MKGLFAVRVTQQPTDWFLFMVLQSESSPGMGMLVSVAGESVMDGWMDGWSYLTASGKLATPDAEFRVLGI